MHTCTLSMCAHTHMHACKHTTHMHTPQSGTKHQADDLTSRILLLETILKSSKPAPHVIYKVTHCSPERGTQQREGHQGN